MIACHRVPIPNRPFDQCQSNWPTWPGSEGGREPSLTGATILLNRRVAQSNLHITRIPPRRTRGLSTKQRDTITIVYVFPRAHFIRCEWEESVDAILNETVHQMRNGIFTLRSAFRAISSFYQAIIKSSSQWRTLMDVLIIKIAIIGRQSLPLGSFKMLSLKRRVRSNWNCKRVKTDKPTFSFCVTS